MPDIFDEIAPDQTAAPAAAPAPAGDIFDQVAAQSTPPMPPPPPPVLQNQQPAAPSFTDPLSKLTSGLTPSPSAAVNLPQLEQPTAPQAYSQPVLNTNTRPPVMPPTMGGFPMDSAAVQAGVDARANNRLRTDAQLKQQMQAEIQADPEKFDPEQWRYLEPEFYDPYPTQDVRLRTGDVGGQQQQEIASLAGGPTGSAADPSAFDMIDTGDGRTWVRRRVARKLGLDGVPTDQYAAMDQSRRDNEAIANPKPSKMPEPAPGYDAEPGPQLHAEDQRQPAPDFNQPTPRADGGKPGDLESLMALLHTPTWQQKSEDYIKQHPGITPAGKATALEAFRNQQGGTKPSDTPEQIAAKTQAGQSTTQNVFAGYARELIGFATAIPKLASRPFSRRYAADLEQGAGILFGAPTENSKAGQVGAMLGSIPAVLAPWGPLLFGAKAAADKVTEAQQLRRAGTPVSNWQEGAAAAFNGLAMYAITSMNFGKLSPATAGRIRVLVPVLAEAAGRKDVALMAHTLMQMAATTGTNGLLQFGDGYFLQVAQNIVNRATINPNAGPFDNAVESGTAMAVFGTVLAAAHGIGAIPRYKPTIGKLNAIHEALVRGDVDPLEVRQGINAVTNLRKPVTVGGIELTPWDGVAINEMHQQMTGGPAKPLKPAKPEEQAPTAQKPPAPRELPGPVAKPPGSDSGASETPPTQPSPPPPSVPPEQPQGPGAIESAPPAPAGAQAAPAGQKFTAEGYDNRENPVTLADQAKHPPRTLRELQPDGTMQPVDYVTVLTGTGRFLEVPRHTLTPEGHTRIWTRGKGYDLKAAQPLLEDGVQLPEVAKAKDGETVTVQGESKTWDLHKGTDESGRPVVLSFGEHQATPPSVPAPTGAGSTSPPSEKPPQLPGGNEAIGPEGRDIGDQQDAIRAKNPAHFALGAGDTTHEERQQAHNDATREVAALWGFKPSDITIGEDGWAGYTWPHAEHLDAPPAIKGHVSHDMIQLRASPTGLWAFDHTLSVGYSGSGAAPSIWNSKQFASRDDALRAAIESTRQEAQRLAGKKPTPAAEKDLKRINKWLDSFDVPPAGGGGGVQPKGEGVKKGPPGQPQNDLTGRSDTPTSESPPAAEPTVPKPPAPVKPVGKFTLPGLENHLIQVYDEHHAGAEAEQDVEEEHATEEIGGAATVFRRDPNTKTGYPKEITDRFTPQEFARLRASLFGKPPIIRFAKGPEMAGAEDAFSEQGMGIEAYVQMLKRALQGTKSRKLAKAVKFASTHPDPQVQLVHGLYTLLTKRGSSRRKQEITKVGDIAAGEEWTHNGVHFELFTDEDGHRLVKDGEDFPVLPADALDEIPIDKGSRHEKPLDEGATGEGDPFADLPEETKPAPPMAEGPYSNDENQPALLDGALDQAKGHLQAKLDAERAISLLPHTKANEQKLAKLRKAVDQALELFDATIEEIRSAFGDDIADQAHDFLSGVIDPDTGEKTPRPLLPNDTPAGDEAGPGWRLRHPQAKLAVDAMVQEYLDGKSDRRPYEIRKRGNHIVVLWTFPNGKRVENGVLHDDEFDAESGKFIGRGSPHSPKDGELLEKLDLPKHGDREEPAPALRGDKPTIAETVARTGLDPNDPGIEHMGPGHGWPRADDLKPGDKSGINKVLKVWRTATAKEADGLLHVTLQAPDGRQFGATGKDAEKLPRPPKFYEGGPPTQTTGTGIFGQTEVLGGSGIGQQNPIFHEPNGPAPINIPGETDRDVRIRNKYDPNATQSMFGEGQGDLFALPYTFFDEGGKLPTVEQLVGAIKPIEPKNIKMRKGDSAAQLAHVASWLDMAAHSAVIRLPKYLEAMSETDPQKTSLAYILLRDALGELAWWRERQAEVIAKPGLFTAGSTKYMRWTDAENRIKKALAAYDKAIQEAIHGKDSSTPARPEGPDVPAGADGSKPPQEGSAPAPRLPAPGHIHGLHDLAQGALAGLGHTVERSPDGVTITTPDGTTAIVRLRSNTTFPKSPGNFFASLFKETSTNPQQPIEMANGDMFAPPRNKEEWDALSEAKQKRVLEVYMPASCRVVNGPAAGEIWFDPRFLDRPDVLREEIFHDWMSRQSPANRALILKDFEGDTPQAREEGAVRRMEELRNGETAQTAGDWQMKRFLAGERSPTAVPEEIAKIFDEPVYDEDYKGERFVYATQHRPPGYGGAPKGRIIGADKPSDVHKFGTIEYPRKLTAEEVKSFQLTPISENAQYAIRRGDDENAKPDEAGRKPTDLGAARAGGPERPKRPGIRVADEGSLPTPPKVVGADSYKAGLDKEQQLGVNLALNRFDNGGAGFLLADGTGVGKTRQILAIADQFKQLSGGEPVLIITQNKQIIAGSFTSDAKAMGIDLSKLELGTYDDLRNGKVGNKPKYGLVIYDEAHNLKNVHSGKALAAHELNATHKVFATATPLDRPVSAAYFMAEITGKTHQEIERRLGYTIHRGTDARGEPTAWAELNSGMTWTRVMDNMIAMRQAAVQAGAMVRREYPFFGHIENHAAPLTHEELDEQREIDRYWNVRIQKAFGPGKRNMAGQRILELSRWLESKKIPHMIERLKEELAAGRQVVVVAENVNDSVVKGLGGAPATGMIGALAKWLQEQGIPFARIYGSGDKGSEVAKFQGGKARVALATPQSGGAGINLDDVEGDKPRTMLVATPNFSGDVFDQMVGRTSRRNTASPSKIGFMIADQGISDTRRKSILGQKLEALRKIQSGMDMDRAVGLTPDEKPGGQFAVRRLEGGGGGLPSSIDATELVAAAKAKLGKRFGGVYVRKYGGGTQVEVDRIKDGYAGRQREMIARYPIPADQVDDVKQQLSEGPKFAVRRPGGELAKGFRDAEDFVGKMPLNLPRNYMGIGHEGGGAQAWAADENGLRVYPPGSEHLSISDQDRQAIWGRVDHKLKAISFTYRHGISKMLARATADQLRQQFPGYAIKEFPVVAGGELLPDEAQYAIRAYHGSPHDFDEFDSSKIGTGEGHQVFGYGHYFADMQAVAKEYRDTLSKTSRAHNTFDGKRLSKELLHDLAATDEDARTLRNLYGFAPLSGTDLRVRVDEHIASAKADLADWEQRLATRKASDELHTIHSWSVQDYQDRVDGEKARIRRLESARTRLAHVPEKKHGKIYEAALAPEQHELLDWDKPLNEQSDFVQKAIAQLEESWKFAGMGTDGSTIYNNLAASLGTQALHDTGRSLDNPPAAASAKLLQLGIRGIKYRDQFSRQAKVDWKNADVAKKYDPTTKVTARQFLHSAGYNLPSAIAGLERYAQSTHWQGYSKIYTDAAEALRNGDLIDKPTHNYVIFDDKDVSIEAKYAVRRLRQDKEKPLTAEEYKSVMEHSRDKAVATADAAVREQIKKFPDTPFATFTAESLATQKEIARLIEDPHAHTPRLGDTSMKQLIQKHGIEGAWMYAESTGVIGTAEKPVNAVNSSLTNCNPTPDCAKYCYVARASSNYNMAGPRRKAELMDVLAKQDPMRLGKLIAAEYKTKPEYHVNKALRFFDAGDFDINAAGESSWVKVIHSVNAEGVRVQVFSKQPKALEQLDPANVRLLSIDSSNPGLAEGNDLPLAVVYKGIQDLPMLEKYADRIQVILPVVLKSHRLLDDSDLDAIPKKFAPYVCPIDAGLKVLPSVRAVLSQEAPTDMLGDVPDEWACTKCDGNGVGLGCFFKQTTQPGHLSGHSDILNTVRRIERSINNGNLSAEEKSDLHGQLSAIADRLQTDAAAAAGTARGQGGVPADSGARPKESRATLTARGKPIENAQFAVRRHDAGGPAHTPSTPVQGQSIAHYASLPAETPGGGKLLEKFKDDPTGDKVGSRSIVDYVNQLMAVPMHVGKTQTTKRNPAHYLSRYHIIRSRSGAWQLNFHEAGHALSALLRDAKKGWSRGLGEALIALTQEPGSFASAKSAEEGVAEWIRRYVTDPVGLPQALNLKMESAIDAVGPQYLEGLRDAHRAWAAHVSRPMEAQLRSYTSDVGQPPPLAARVANLWDGFLFHMINAEAAIDRLDRSQFNGIRAFSIELARQFREGVRDTPADVKSAFQSTARVPQEVARAIGGANEGHEGIRVLATGGGFDDLPEYTVSKPDGTTEEVSGAEALRRGGFDVPDVGARHGGWVYVNGESFRQIYQDVIGATRTSTITNSTGTTKVTLPAKGADPRIWDAFETYGQMRAALHRYSKKGHMYPGLTEGFTPDRVRAWLKEQEDANPTWADQFKRINAWMDQLLLVPVLSGEFDVPTAIKIRKAWEDYWPLPRMTEGGAPDRAGGGGTDPSAGVRRAWGSHAPFKSLQEAIDRRVKSAMEAYYQNRLMLAVHRAGLAMSRIKGLPLADAAKGLQVMLPLHLELKKVATLREDEQQKIIARYLNEQKARELGIDVADLPPEDTVKAEDVEIATPGVPIYRRKRPNAVHVVAPFENGQRSYYQITDPLLFDLFSRSSNPAKAVAWLAHVGTTTIAPWKRALTRNIVFSLRNFLARDPATALTRGEGAGSVIPGFYGAMGLINRLKGDPFDVAIESELLSKALDATTSKAHQSLRERFNAVLSEGIVVPGWSNMSLLDRAGELPGQMMSSLMKPIDVALWATGQTYLAQLSEELTREGAAVQARQKGASSELAMEAADRITGNFAMHAGNPNVASLFRTAGFLNPGLQILYGQYQRLSDPDPAVRSTMWTKLAWLGAIGAVAAAINYLLTSEENRNKLRERPDAQRFQNAAVLGKFAFPFENGLPGAVASLGWNSVESWLLKDKIKGEDMARGVLSNALSMPGPLDAVHPWIKTYLEERTNYSLYQDRNIVPSWLMEAYPNEPAEQATPGTPETYRAIGRAMNASPMKVEYGVRSVFTSQMDDVVRIVESVARGRFKINEAADVPLFGRLFIREPIGWRSKSVQTVADMADQAEALKRVIKSIQERPTLSPAEQARLEKASKMVEQLQDATRQLGNIRRDWRGAKQLEKLNTPEGDRQMQDIMRGMTKGSRPVAVGAR